MTVNPIETLNMIPSSQPSTTIQNNNINTIPFNIYNDGKIK